MVTPPGGWQLTAQAALVGGRPDIDGHVLAWQAVQPILLLLHGRVGVGEGVGDGGLTALYHTVVLQQMLKILGPDIEKRWRCNDVRQ